MTISKQTGVLHERDPRLAHRFEQACLGHLMALIEAEAERAKPAEPVSAVAWQSHKRTPTMTNSFENPACLADLAATR